ncbi:Fpg/Nei family DNA glycosylase [Arthrobacter sp. Soil763]|uniref:Fpg/Nei family DNA glycosylase n=1 Tax=Arthrobacter sp. Soil763 TaxID=1736402 RepID=UPI0006FDD9C0|nr:DNA glycosylase [Arthrobacter sp. Soil763]KRE80200.1 formamidopyrimidine-DNA glycosylase [Arthrobacter sp. Soil763]
MPEGHSIHRLARQFADVFVAERLAVTSPQGRFAQGAALLDGHVLTASAAHGKHLFLTFDHGLVLHVHLGLYGAWDFGGDAHFRGASSIGAPRRVGEREVSGGPGPESVYAGPPAPVGAVRVRLASAHGWADLRGATTCETLTEAEAEAVTARLGPDPLRNLPGDRDGFIAALAAKRSPLARLLMDQKVIAGVGNVYRAELLFRQRLDPLLPGTALDAEAAGRLWDDTVAVMSDGVRDGRIVTTAPRYWTSARAGGTGVVGDGGLGARSAGTLPEPGDAHFVYRRHGLECRDCGGTVALAEHAARKLYWCPACQRA